MKNKKIQIPLIAIFSIIGAILYRMGGAKGFNTKIRDLGVTTVFIALLTLLNGWSWWYILCFVLMFGSLTTYWDFLFGQDNFYCHGFVIGIACFPLIWAGVAWWLILIRALVLAGGMGAVNKYVNKWGWKHTDIVEECFRGALIIISVPLLFL